MRALFVVCACAALLQSPPASADCTLAFAPPAIRQAASEHYYRSSKRDSTPPGRLPSADRRGDVRDPKAGDSQSGDGKRRGHRDSGALSLQSGRQSMDMQRWKSLPWWPSAARKGEVVNRLAGLLASMASTALPGNPAHLWGRQIARHIAGLAAVEITDRGEIINCTVFTTPGVYSLHTPDNLETEFENSYSRTFKIVITKDELGELSAGASVMRCTPG